MNTLNFDLPIGQSSIIKVIGVGGGGGNAVNHMFREGITGVDFIVCNTDAQALDHSPVSNRIQLGPELTRGLGAGSIPEKGREACEESAGELRELLSRNTRMVFITAGMGGGTGTGAAPVVARIARELGILTVGIVTTPFSFEGNRKFRQALAGIEELKKNVDTVIVISNDKISKMYGSLRKSEAFNLANNILTTAAKGISEIITIPGEINVDFADVEYVMSNGGTALMGNGCAEGEGRALAAVKAALSSPLLNDSRIQGAKKVLLNITAGVGDNQVTIDEISSINEYLQLHARDTDIIFGSCDDEQMGAKLAVTLIATGFVFSEVQQPVEVVPREILTLHDEPVFEQITTATEKVIIPLEQEISVSDDLESNNSAIPILPELAVVEEEEKAYSLFDMLDAADSAPSLESMQIEYVINTEEDSLSEEQIENQIAVSDAADIDSVEDSVDTPIEVEVESSSSAINTTPSEVFSDSKADEWVVSESAVSTQMEMQDIPEYSAEDERRRRLQRLSYRLDQQRDLSQLETEPAWKRRGVDIGNAETTRYSDSGIMSRYSIGDSALDDQNVEIRKNGNGFMDAVD